MEKKKCKFCKSEIDKEATVCPICKRDQHDTKKARLLTTIISLVLVAGLSIFIYSLIDSMIGKDNNTIYNLNDRIEFDDKAITVLSYETKERESDIWSAGSGNEFYIITIKLENISNTTQTFSSSNFEIIDTNGEIHNTETLIKTEELGSAELTADSTVTKNIRFAIKKGNTSVMLKYTNGFLGDTVKIKIK